MNPDTNKMNHDTNNTIFNKVQNSSTKTDKLPVIQTHSDSESEESESSSESESESDTDTKPKPKSGSIGKAKKGGVLSHNSESDSESDSE